MAIQGEVETLRELCDAVDNAATVLKQDRQNRTLRQAYGNALDKRHNYITSAHWRAEDESACNALGYKFFTAKGVNSLVKTA